MYSEDNIKDICEKTEIHEDIIRDTAAKMPDMDTLFNLAEVFKVFGDTTRIRIMCALFENELCVCDISEILGMGQSAVSHQLRILRNAKLVKVRKDGKSSYYSFDDDHVKKIFELGLAHITELS